MQRFNNPLLHSALLIFIVFLMYTHTFDAGFMFDDYAQQEMLKLISRGSGKSIFLTSSPRLRRQPTIPR